VIDLAAGELDDGAGIVEAMEVADESEDESAVEGVGSGDAIEEECLGAALISGDDLVAEMVFLGLEKTATLGCVADANGNAFTGAANGIAIGVLEERKEGDGPGLEDIASLGGPPNASEPRPG
jgi:hypothetical protein